MKLRHTCPAHRKRAHLGGTTAAAEDEDDEERGEGCVARCVANGHASGAQQEQQPRMRMMRTSEGTTSQLSPCNATQLVGRYTGPFPLNSKTAPSRFAAEVTNEKISNVENKFTSCRTNLYNTCSPARRRSASPGPAGSDPGRGHSGRHHGGRGHGGRGHGCATVSAASSAVCRRGWKIRKVTARTL